LRENGDEVLIVVKNREEMVTELLDENGEDYILVGGNVRGLVKKALYLILYEAKLLKISVNFKPDLFVSVNSPYSAHVSTLLRKPHLSWTDTEISKIILYLVAPFTQTMMTPMSFSGNFAFKNHVKINSFKELTYLHPNYFKPDSAVIEEVDLKNDEKFVIVRFSAYDASHDVGLRGLNQDSREKLVLELSKIAKVFVTSEVDLGPKINGFSLSLKKTRIHDLLGFASLYVGEGAVMASEAAMLGIPSIFINPSSRGYIDELRKSGLVHHYKNSNKDIEKIIDRAKNVLTSDHYRQESSVKRKKMIAEKVDLNIAILSEIEKFRRKKS